MAKSERLRLRDVRAAFRLVGEVVELGADPHDWWPHLLEGLCRLTGAAAAIGGELEGLFFLDSRVRVLGNYFAGFDEEGVQRFTHFMVHEKWRTIHEAGERYYRLRGNGAPVDVRSGDQLIARDRWRRSELFQDYIRPSRIDDQMYSFCQTPNGRSKPSPTGRGQGEATPTDALTPTLSHGERKLWNGISLHGGLGDRPFTGRERRLLRLVHSELRPLVGTKIASLSGSPARSLSPRLRQTRDLLLSGRSEKQIAEQCGLAKSTVNEYVAAIYQRYGVSSRAELMARFLRWCSTCRGENTTSQFPEHRSPGESEPGQ